MSTGVFGAPTTLLVAGSVAWNEKGVGTPVTWVTPHLIARAPTLALRILPAASATLRPPVPALRTLANAVATTPTWTERLVGSTAATSGGGGRHSESSRVANEKTPAWLAT